MNAKLSIYIIAYNEATKIADAVNSALWADEVIVADSHSSDDTVKIAEELGARVIQIDFKGFGDLRNNAIAACRHEWIFSLDADERCTPEAQAEIQAIINDPNALDVYYTPRKNIFLGRVIKHSWPYPDYRQPQLFRKGSMTYCEDQVHEGFISHSDKVLGHMQQSIWQIPFSGLEQLLVKVNRYSTLGVDLVRKKGKKPGKLRTLWHASWNFFKHYILKRGFLDGWPGFIIAFSNFEGTFYRYAKTLEASKSTKILNNRET